MVQMQIAFLGAASAVFYFVCALAAISLVDFMQYLGRDCSSFFGMVTCHVTTNFLFWGGLFSVCYMGTGNQGFMVK